VSYPGWRAHHQAPGLRWTGPPLTAVVVLHATTFQVGLLSSASTVAFALIALPAGAIVDRRAKRRLTIWCDLARMLIIGSVPLAAALGVLTMGQLYAVAITAGVCTVFFDVSYQSYLPALIGKEDLVDGNGKLVATQSFAQVACSALCWACAPRCGSGSRAPGPPDGGCSSPRCAGCATSRS
jgi:MFS family permease